MHLFIYIILLYSFFVKYYSYLFGFFIMFDNFFSFSAYFVYNTVYDGE